MSTMRITRSDCVGLARPALDAHTLGLASVAQLLTECGYRCMVADSTICAHLETPDRAASIDAIARWIADHKITVLGLSYRLDPKDGVQCIGQFVTALKHRRLLKEQGGPIRFICFAGLPQTCVEIQRHIPEINTVFEGDETASETLERLGLDATVIPPDLITSARYDADRLAFGRDLIRKGNHKEVAAVNRHGYREFGSRQDSLPARLHHGIQHALPPIIRAHVGPYGPNREETIRLFLDWCQQLARTGLLDVLSIGTSQLTQSNFGEDWAGSPNGGGVPLNTRDDFAAVWTAARPMLVRTYAGTKDIPALARMYEETINIAWHALSLWWFCRIDGRGPYSVRQNLQQHLATLNYIASTGKPFEANVPHHFAFRGADDVTYIVSAVIAARVAKAQGIRHYVLQNMLNTPKYTWGIQDLAKARAMLQLVRELEDKHFRVILQPRGGLDYFSHDPEKAKAQLAAVTALMDDIEPDNPASPPVIHVVSYSEGSHLADPPTVDESIQITRHALAEYRKLRQRGSIDNMAQDPDVASRTAELVREARYVLSTISSAISTPCSPDGLYQVLARGFLPVPYLWECREEFPNACNWQTRLVRGSVKVVDNEGRPLGVEERMQRVLAQGAGISPHPGENAP